MGAREDTAGKKGGDAESDDEGNDKNAKVCSKLRSSYLCSGFKV